MSSTRDSNGTGTLYRMIEDLSNYKRSREEIINSAVKTRLNESFRNYYDSIMRAYDKLEYANELKLLRKLNKM